MPGVPYHVTQRGNRRVPVFREREDHVLCIDLLGHHSVKHALSIAAYCLMPNHVHLVVNPEAVISISLTLQDTPRVLRPPVQPEARPHRTPPPSLRSCGEDLAVHGT
ncbi:MAG: transposase [Candidatus Eisenbacteria bacterium]